MGSKRLELNLLGETAMTWQGKEIALPPPKQFALLCYLAVKNTQVSRTELAEVLWGEGKSSPVRHALHHLKTLPGADEWLVVMDKAVSLNCSCDATNFDESVDAKKYYEAVTLWNSRQESNQGLLPLFSVRHAPEFAEWLNDQRQRLINRYFNALENCIESQILTGATDAALDNAYKWLNFESASDTIEDVNEVAYQYVIELEHRSGRSETAMLNFQELKQRLAKQNELPSKSTLELIKKIEEESIKAGTKALLLDANTTVPNLPEVFVGRDAVIETVKNALSEHRQVLLQGFGGIGKTTLAATIAKDFSQNENVIWLEAGEENYESCCEAIITACFSDDPKKQKTASLLDAILEKSVALIILDDISNAVTLEKFRETLVDVEKSLLLATSRIRFRKIAHVELSGLERKDSLELLNHHSERELENQEIETQICELLDDHPFSVRIAGITLKQNQLDSNQLLLTLKEQPHSLNEFNQSGRNSVEQLLQFSLDYCTDEEYEVFFAYSALFQPSVTPELLSICLRRLEEETESALYGLHQRGLVQRQFLTGSDLISYKMHDLAFSFTKDKGLLRATSTWKAIPEYLNRHLDKVEFVEGELSNVLGAAQLAPDRSRVEIMELLALKGQYFNARGHNSLSIKLLDEAAQLAENIQLLEAAMNLYGKLADAYINSYGDYSSAISVIKQALDIAREIDNQYKEALYLNMHGIAKLTVGQQDGEDDLRMALKLAKGTNDFQCIGTVLSQHGYIYGELKEFEKANSSLKEALDILRQFKQENVDSHELVRREFFAVLNFAVSEHDLGRSSVSLQLNEEALHLAKEYSNEIWMAHACSNIGEVHIDLNNSIQAKNYLSKAQSLYKKNNMIAKSEEISYVIEKYSLSLPLH